MQFTTLLLVGEADRAAREDVVRYARTRGFRAVGGDDEIDGETGRVITPLAHIVGGRNADTEREAVEAVGLKHLHQITRLTLADAWRQLHNVSAYALQKIILHMDAEGIGFADGPATPMANGYRNSGYILPELPALDQQIRTALRHNSVLCIELIRALADAELLELRMISPDRLRRLRWLIREYDERQS